MKVVLLDSVDWSRVERLSDTKKLIEETATKAANDARELLDFASDFINITIQPNAFAVTPGYGTGGYTVNSEFITVSFHPDMPNGIEDLQQELRATVFHELNHAARWNVIVYDEQILEGVVFEGLATVFEREHAGSKPLYGTYEDDETMQQWLKEILSLENFGLEFDQLKFNHPDGRQWVIYKTGTWLIDKAVETSGKSVVELTKLSADEIMEFTRKV